MSGFYPGRKRKTKKNDRTLCAAKPAETRSRRPTSASTGTADLSTPSTTRRGIPFASDASQRPGTAFYTAFRLMHSPGFPDSGGAFAAAGVAGSTWDGITTQERRASSASSWTILSGKANRTEREKRLAEYYTFFTLPGPCGGHRIRRAVEPPSLRIFCRRLRHRGKHAR